MAEERQTTLVEQDRLLLALRRLNMIIPNHYPILSLYLTANKESYRLKQTLEFIDQEMKRITKHLAKQGLNPQVFQDDIARIKEFIEFNVKDQSLGLAAFMSGYKDLFLTYPINYQFKNRIVLDYDAYKAPLVRLLSEQPREIFITLFADQSILYKYSDGKLQQKEDPIKRERHKREKRKDYIYRIKDTYWPYIRSEDVKYVFLMGTPTLMEQFVAILAKTVIQKIKEQISLPSSATKKDFEQVARNVIRKYNILNPAAKVEHAKKLAQRRMAIFGNEGVLGALREGKVKELLLDPRFDPKGYRCQRCKLLGTLPQKHCPRCRGNITRIKHIKEAILRDAAVYDIAITRVKHPFLRQEGNGIAAILRFS